MNILYENLLAFHWQDLVMIGIGCVLIFLAIKKEMEPSLLLPMGLGTILVNIPGSTALVGPIQELYHAGIANELFPLLLFIGIGAMIDFGPLLSNPKMFLFGAAAQFGIFFVLVIAVIAVLIAANPNSGTIMGLVENAWGVFGAAFGPTILLSLFWKRFNFAGAVAGIAVGAVVDIVWYAFLSSTGIYEIIPGFFASALAAVVVTLLTKKPDAEVEALYDRAVAYED